MEVPSVLTCGDHKKVERWRRKQSILRTRDRRPDLYAKLDLSSKEDQKLLAEIRAEELYKPLPHPVSIASSTQEAWDTLPWPHSPNMPEHSYILCHGDQAAACFSLTPLEAQAYMEIQDGKWSAQEPSLWFQLHGTDPELTHTDFVPQMLACVRNLGRDLHAPWIRTAADKRNKAWLAHLKQAGFQYRGNLSYDNLRQVAYELRLK